MQIFLTFQSTSSQPFKREFPQTRLHRWFVLLCGIHRFTCRNTWSHLPLATPYQTFPLPYPTHTALLRQRCGNTSSQSPCLAFSDQAHPCKIPLYPWTCAQGHYLRYAHLLFRQPHRHLHQATQPYRLWAPSTPPRAQLALCRSAWGGVLHPLRRSVGVCGSRRGHNVQSWCHQRGTQTLSHATSTKLGF
jgi:hypothetical protein